MSLLILTAIGGVGRVQAQILSSENNNTKNGQVAVNSYASSGGSRRGIATIITPQLPGELNYIQLYMSCNWGSPDPSKIHTLTVYENNSGQPGTLIETIVVVGDLGITSCGGFKWVTFTSVENPYMYDDRSYFIAYTNNQGNADPYAWDVSFSNNYPTNQDLSICKYYDNTWNSNCYYSNVYTLHRLYVTLQPTPTLEPSPTASPSATPIPTIEPTATPSGQLGLQDEEGFQFLGQILAFALGMVGYTVLASNLYKR